LDEHDDPSMREKDSYFRVLVGLNHSKNLDGDRKKTIF